MSSSTPLTLAKVLSSLFSFRTDYKHVSAYATLHSNPNLKTGTRKLTIPDEALLLPVEIKFLYQCKYRHIFNSRTWINWHNIEEIWKLNHQWSLFDNTVFFELRKLYKETLFAFICKPPEVQGNRKAKANSLLQVAKDFQNLKIINNYYRMFSLFPYNSFSIVSWDQVKFKRSSRDQLSNKT